MKKLTLATSQYCGPCQMVKEYITKNNINVEIKDVMDDREYFVNEGVKSVPVLIVEDDGNKTKYIGGKDILDYLQS